MGNLMRALEFSRAEIGRVLKGGDRALDATCGNGKDTLFLAGCVGPEGRVFAVDIQMRAVEETKKLLASHGLAGRVTVLKQSHEELLDFVSPPLKAAMFNLGYLPGGDHGVVTRPESTVKALEAVFSLLVPGGLVSVVAYSGHPGGQEEVDEVQEYLEGLEQGGHSVLHYRFINQANHPPQLFLIEKL